MKLQLALCVAALALAACSKTETDGSASTGGAAQKRMPLPDCTTVKTEDKGADGWKHPDCRQMLADKSGLAVEARYTPAEDDSTKLKVQVVATGDATLQTIEETMGNTFSGISVEDVDKDGKDDLLLPLETGNVNTTWAFWRQNEDGKSFTRVGEPNGVEIKKTDSGYFAVPSRSAANEWEIAFFKLTPAELTPILTADVVAKGEPDKITGVDCTVTDDGGLGSTGLTADAAKTQFCAEPVVADIFK